MMKKKKDEPNSQEPNIHVVSAKIPDNVYPCVPKKTGVPKNNDEYFDLKYFKICAYFNISYYMNLYFKLK